MCLSEGYVRVFLINLLIQAYATPLGRACSNIRC
ncbi:hypothetical protein PQC55_gp141 [Escherichia phage vB_EcoP-CHD5UKE1]|uniref:Uncharacterized protein n=1 Tax=Escherichia phage vB_EcoP-CHD5UKE1 TaxID=2865805 RepID=A0ABX9AGY9_9CAUD|nr:hypothetical protein PQC55_gp141 [Escherichia phage vB_EcoP-CHD5UKE1]QZI80617.1 hypothetical protein CHD5UKE1_121 [Escherichia phage vB_EcoP-CHD5UKE1]WIW36277.1 hypothetical protein [Escherichia phage pEC-N1203-2Af.1]DAE36510.1 MAG TPA: hypothetical protein [Caudoviricetes sp.]